MGSLQPANVCRSLVLVEAGIAGVPSGLAGAAVDHCISDLPDLVGLAGLAGLAGLVDLVADQQIQDQRENFFGPPCLSLEGARPKKLHVHSLRTTTNMQ